MSYVLGISCFYHDSAASLVGDEGVICAAEEERFTRIKHDSSFPKNAIKFCLNFKNLNENDLSAVVFYENPITKFERVSKSFIRNLPRSSKIFLDILKGWHSEKFWIKEIICKNLKIDKKKFIFLNTTTPIVFLVITQVDLKIRFHYLLMVLENFKHYNQNLLIVITEMKNCYL